MKIVNSLDESRLLIKGFGETFKIEVKEQKEGFLGMLLGNVVTSLLGNLLTSQGQGTIRAGHDFHPLKNLEMQKYYQNKPEFNGVHSRHSLPKIKDGASVINLDE